jgi:hypothetical protein
VARKDFFRQVDVLNKYGGHGKDFPEKEKEHLRENAELDLVALIYNGIGYNSHLVATGELKVLSAFPNLGELNRALLGIFDYKCQKLQGAVVTIFTEAARVVKQLKQTDLVDGNVKVDLTTLFNRINDMNTLINNDHELFSLAHMLCDYASKYFLNTNFTIKVENTIIKILQDNNEATINGGKYGGFLKGVLKVLATWNTTSIGGGGTWNTAFEGIKHTAENNPFLLSICDATTGNLVQGDQTDDCFSGVDFLLNKVQDILYKKICLCCFSTTFLEVQKCYELTIKILVNNGNGLFSKLARLRENALFQGEVSFRALDLLGVCLPVDSNTGGCFSFWLRLPQLDREYFPDLLRNTAGGTPPPVAIEYINRIESAVTSVRSRPGWGQIHNAIGKLFDFILIHNPNEVVEICNRAFYYESLEDWGRRGALDISVRRFDTALKNFISLYGKRDVGGRKIFFAERQDGVGQCVSAMEIAAHFFNDGSNYKSGYYDIPMLPVSGYYKFCNDQLDLERRIYHLLDCFRFLFYSISRKFLPDTAMSGDNFKNASRILYGLAFVIANNIASIVINCARGDTGWEMYGLNQSCKLHQGGLPWGRAIFYFPGDPQNVDFLIPFGGTPIEFSPFVDHLLQVDDLANFFHHFYFSLINATSSITILIGDPDLFGLKGINGALLTPPQGNDVSRACCFPVKWHKTDFNNFIIHLEDVGKYLIFKSGGGRKVFIDNSLSSENFDRVDGLTQYGYLTSLRRNVGLVPREVAYEPCGKVNDLLATWLGINHGGYLPLDEVFAKMKESRFQFGSKVRTGYFSLAKENFEANYSIETIDNTVFTLHGGLPMNWGNCLLKVNTYIGDYDAAFGTVRVPKSGDSWEELLMGSDEQKALALLFVQMSKGLMGSEGGFISLGAENIIKAFIPTKKVEGLVTILKKKVLKLINWEYFGQLLTSKQFAHEVCCMKNPDDVQNKVNNYFGVVKVFNDTNFSLRVKNSLVPGSANGMPLPSLFEQAWKNKCGGLVKEICKAWCVNVVAHKDPGDKSIAEILNGLWYGKETPEILNPKAINTLKWLNTNKGDIENFFAARYTGGSLTGLSDGLNKANDVSTEVNKSISGLNANPIDCTNFNLLARLIRNLGELLAIGITDLRDATIQCLWEGGEILPAFISAREKFYDESTKLLSGLPAVGDLNKFRRLADGKGRKDLVGLRAYQLSGGDSEFNRLKGEIGKNLSDLQKLLNNYKTALDNLDNQTNTSRSSYFEKLKYIAANYGDPTKTIAKALKLDGVGGQLVLEQIWKNVEDIDNFVRLEGFTNPCRDINRVLQQVLLVTGNLNTENPFDSGLLLRQNPDKTVQGNSVIYPGLGAKARELLGWDTLRGILK